MHNRISKRLMILAAVGLLAGGIASTAIADRKSHGEGIAVRHAWVRPTPPGMMITAAYLSIYNDGKEADRLIGVSSSAAETVEVHQVIEKDGMMHMQPVEGGIELPSGGVVRVRPGGFHLMMIGLKAPIMPGDKLQLKLNFERLGPVNITATARMNGTMTGEHKHGGRHAQEAGHAHGSHGMKKQ